MVEMPVDPLEPPKFKHKRIPRASGSPPVPVMHSPPRPVTVKDQQDWKIPPCISNWKNPKGEAVAMRSKVQKEMMMKEKERKEQELRALAQKARAGGADEQMDKIMKTDRFKPDRAFTGTADRAPPRDRPVEFDKEAEEADPFGLDQFLTEVKKGKKADRGGGGGTMRASGGGSSNRDNYDGGSGRSRIGFERGH
ncbi:SNW/SKI-interacting protein [Linum perenne]